VLVATAGDLFEKVHPFRRETVLEDDEAGGVAARL
jgi:hypothetical protein